MGHSSTRGLSLALLAATCLACHPKPKKPKNPDAAKQAPGEVTVTWDSGGAITIDNASDAPVVVAVGPQPPPHRDADELTVEASETIALEPDDAEALWGLTDTGWVELHDGAFDDLVVSLAR